MHPVWLLKVIPRADGKGVDIMQVIDNTNVPGDVTVHICMAGGWRRTVQSIAHLQSLRFHPLEYYGAYFLERDHTDGFGEIVHDFKNDA